MKYRNTKTGAEIEAACPISGGDWVAAAEAEPEEKPVPKPAKKATKKKET